MDNQVLPSISKVELRVSKDTESVTITFSGGLTAEEEKQLCQHTMPASEYINFVTSFINVGLEAQKNSGVDLGIPVYVKDGE